MVETNNVDGMQQVDDSQHDKRLQPYPWFIYNLGQINVYSYSFIIIRKIKIEQAKTNFN